MIQFKSSLSEFKNLNFKPLYKFKDLRNLKPESFLKENCFQRGEFCATNDEKFDSDSILEEGIRQSCVWKKDKDLWMKYIVLYRDCLKGKLSGIGKVSGHCFNYIVSQLGLSNDFVDSIEQCFNSSFDQNDLYEANNSILNEQKNTYEFSDIYIVPAVFIDGVQVRGQLTDTGVLSALCGVVNKRPSICYADVFSDLNMDYKTSILQSLFFTLTILATIVGALVLLYLYIRRFSTTSITEEIQREIKGHVTEYMRLTSD